MEAERQRLTPEQRSHLVAYLDGELQGHESEAISRTLGQSSIARHEVDGLKRTWRLLDALERPRASEELTSRTLSIAEVLDASTSRLAGAASRLAERATRMLLLAGLIALCFLAGVATTRWVWPDRAGQLARHLSIAENLDAYRAVGSFEFLEQLDESSELHRLAE